MTIVLAAFSVALVGVAAALGSGHPVAGGTLMAMALVAVLGAHVLDAVRQHEG